MGKKHRQSDMDRYFPPYLLEDYSEDYPGLPHTNFKPMETAQKLARGAISDAVTLAQERIGDETEFVITREQLLHAIAWAAHVGSESTQSHRVSSDELRPIIAGNAADGNEGNWNIKYPPKPLFEEGEK